jgi:hypothetical protein
MTKRQQRHRYELHVLYREWKAYDRQCKECCEQQVHDRQLESRQDNPDDVHDERNRPAGWFSINDRTSERRENTAGESETHESEWNADDCEAQQNATQNVTKEDQESAKYEKHQIANQRHDQKYSGLFPALHLMLQPMLRFCSASGFFDASTASSAARRSCPVIGMLFEGRLSSSWPR